jgi:hypothetical protein
VEAEGRLFVLSLPVLIGKKCPLPLPTCGVTSATYAVAWKVTSVTTRSAFARAWVTWPRSRSIGECLRSVRAMVEGVAGSIVAAPILPRLNPMFEAVLARPTKKNGPPNNSRAGRMGRVLRYGQRLYLIQYAGTVRKRGQMSFFHTPGRHVCPTWRPAGS